MVLYQVIVEHLETFLASLADDPEAPGLPAYEEIRCSGGVIYAADNHASF